MKAMVIYDSYFGNTERIAGAIGVALGPGKDVQTVRAGDVKSEQLASLQLLVVGSPTRAFRPTEAVTRLLKAIAAGGLEGVKVAAFDTRIALGDIKSPLLRFLVNLGGYAAKPISDRLRRKGGEPVVPGEGFLVQGSEGPLKDGELERAVEWAGKIKQAGGLS